MWGKKKRGGSGPLAVLDAMQIEVTSRCSLRCVMCPNLSIPGWEFREMDFKTFKRISEHFHLAKLIYLQGWGEPLLHGRIFDMVKLSKDAGCMAGFTTNGMLLSQETSERLIELELDIIVVSIAGSTRGTHEGIREGSDFEKITGNVRTLLEIKKKKNADRPRVNLSFIMTRENIGELPEVIEMANELGVGEVVATNLDSVQSPSQDRLRVFSCEGADEEFEKIIGEAKKKAKGYGIVFRPYPLMMEELVMCELNPLGQVFVSCEGLVSPCNYINFPMDGPIPRMFCGEESSIERTYFGDISKEAFSEIWKNPGYQEFRHSYEKRKLAKDRIFGGLDLDADPVEIREAEGRLKTELKSLPVPEVCRTCYKAYGI